VKNINNLEQTFYTRKPSMEYLNSDLVAAKNLSQKEFLGINQ
jgi:hypothetical protein